MGCQKTSHGIIVISHIEKENNDKARRNNLIMTNKEVVETIYPCQFPIKVIGENTEKLKEVLINVMSSFDEVIHPDEMATTHSKNEKYVSITFKIVAKSRDHIEQIYSALHAQKEVKMVL
jgi:putative lipoic acid-binding regulatory protein